MVQDDLGGLAEKLVAVANLRILAFIPALLECLALAHRLEDVGLRLYRLLEYQSLRLVGLPLGIALVAIPLHEALGVLIRYEGALQAPRLRFPRRNEQHVAAA